MSLQRTPTKTKTVRVFDKREDIIGYVTPLAATKLINAGVAKKWDDRVNGEGVKLLVNDINEADRKRYRHQSNEERKKPCWECGEIVENVSRGRMVRCQHCKEKHETNQVETAKQYQHLRQVIMFNNAVVILTKAARGIIFSQYEKVYKDVKEKVHSGTWRFDSAYEIVTAMELIRQNVVVELQQKILKYRADVVLPEYRIVLEVDGKYHHRNKDKDKQRDADIKKALGPLWDIVRVPTDILTDNVKELLPAILEVKKSSQKWRGGN